MGEFHQPLCRGCLTLRRDGVGRVAPILGDGGVRQVSATVCGHIHAVAIQQLCSRHEFVVRVCFGNTQRWRLLR